MLLEIREKVHGLFASIILILICVLFGLWGIQNYLGGGKEAPVVSVGDKEFYQRDVNQAYQQYAQNLAGMKFDEETLKKQALEKLVRDEVLLQYVQDQNLLVSDDTARDFIQTLEYFQKDGKFDKTQYQTMLGSQGMSSAEFVNRIKKALVMEQFQRAVVDSSFVTPVEINNFFKIQNQTRDVEYLTVPLTPVSQQPGEEEITAYYQQHQDAYQTPEQVAIEYVELSLDKLAAEIKPSEEQLKAYYEEQKVQFTTKERRKISHILFAFNKDKTADDLALQKALKAKQDLKNKDFAALAAEVSDDKLTAKNGGDLGLFNVGVMEKAFEDAASSLKLGEVSEPVKSAFGYHLIKVTELIPGDVKPYEAVKAEVSKAYQKAQAEAKFNTLAEKVAEVSYENPDSLAAVAQLLGGATSKTEAFTRTAGEGIAADEKVRAAAFSEDVLKGSNSEPLEIGGDKVLVLRMLSHQPAASRELKEVKPQVIAAIQQDKAKQQAIATVDKIKQELASGKTLAQIAETQHLQTKKINGLTRTVSDLPAAVTQEIFRAAKPKAGQPSVAVIDEAKGGKLVVSVNSVHEGVMSDSDKNKQALIAKNISTAFGKAQMEAVLNALQTKADIVINTQKQ
ncbi:MULTISPECIES: SurA N-terminal domain-containing protein [Methylomonas]|uniref:Periplasmic chaperone PpiD n=2 Tax=Methylomonas TaxID=416 RepID=A0A126T7D5_9GAMM|nr:MULTISPECIES: SurA N-terminal domain-containing protein [Methylomonas]AMK78005.1 peptidylprolyl isomerase [Methylomonas denitrificans]OAI07694.1 peptidylprolyl isomerase [Methylomonas methanica]TCV85541.1 peptidyl-prolyl cis-trans isomerase D [Methylomonas methanica]